MCHCSLRQGGEGPGTDQERSNPRLEPTLPKFTSETKEESHGEEEEGQEEKQVLKIQARASYWGSADRTL
jgi:hypothetical protein